MRSHSKHVQGCDWHMFLLLTATVGTVEIHGLTLPHMAPVGATAQGACSRCPPGLVCTWSLVVALFSLLEQQRSLLSLSGGWKTESKLSAVSCSLQSLQGSICSRLFQLLAVARCP